MGILRPTHGCTTLECGEVTTATATITTPPSPTPMLLTPTATYILTTVSPTLTTARGLLMLNQNPRLRLRPIPTFFTVEPTDIIPMLMAMVILMDMDMVITMGSKS